MKRSRIYGKRQSFNDLIKISIENNEAQSKIYEKVNTIWKKRLGNKSRMKHEPNNSVFFRFALFFFKRTKIARILFISILFSL